MNMAESKYAVVVGLKCNDPSKLKKMTLAEARIEACRLAKKYPNSYTRIGIFAEDKYHISGDRYMPKLVEDVDYSKKYRLITGDVLDGFYLFQWTTNRQYRVSPNTGKLLDMNKYFKYL